MPKTKADWLSVWAVVARHVVSIVTTLALLGGTLWFIVKPHAAEFVAGVLKVEVGAQIAAERADARYAASDTVAQIEQRTRRLELRLEEESSTGGRIEADIETLKQLQRESRDDIKQILRSLQSR